MEPSEKGNEVYAVERYDAYTYQWNVVAIFREKRAAYKRADSYPSNVGEYRVSTWWVQEEDK